MTIRQLFKVEGSVPEICEFLRGLNCAAQVSHHENHFAFSFDGTPAFIFDCEVKPGAIESSRSGDYTQFFSSFIEALVNRFGPIEMEDA